MNALAFDFPEHEELYQKPLFAVQQPDGRREWAEDDRQATFRGRLTRAAPRLDHWAHANAGKRAPHKAIKEGIVAGLFDYAVTDGPGFAVYIEFKGYTKAGRPGVLSPDQIRWGNRMLARGHHVACFFCPDAAVAWIRSLRPEAFS